MVYPIQMKKNRPGTMLSVLLGVICAQSCRAYAERDIYFWSTSTHCRRYEAERQIVKVDTSLGKVPVKLKRIGER
ncbi:MAG: hypothetical protein CM1200mP39_28990 [Dehalococcoidia bacterium]|nr:MAG: hypothetical protein CM1200mP39_28990 [Dehalococcoidia bacterium]